MIFLFNGPPGSGKDEAAEFLGVFGVKHLSFKNVLFQATCDQFDVDYEWFMEGYNDRELKEAAVPELDGMSRREAMIYTSESVIKPRYGKEYFGAFVSREIEPDYDYAISDCGFEEELRPVINKIGRENVVLVQLGRDGCTYDNDSRRYVRSSTVENIILGYEAQFNEQHILQNDFAIKTYRVHNNGTLQDFHEALENIYKTVKACNGQSKEGIIA